MTPPSVKIIRYLMKAPLLHLFLHVGHALDAELRERMETLGVQPRQARVLDLIDRVGDGASQADLARRLAISSPSLSVMLARMERDNLVLRAPSDGDARSVIVTLTPAGSESLAFARSVWRELETVLLSRLGPDAVEPARNMLKAVRDAFVTHSPDDIMEKP